MRKVAVTIFFTSLFFVPTELMWKCLAATKHKKRNEKCCWNRFYGWNKKKKNWKIEIHRWKRAFMWICLQFILFSDSQSIFTFSLLPNKKTIFFFFVSFSFFLSSVCFVQCCLPFGLYSVWFDFCHSFNLITNHHRTWIHMLCMLIANEKGSFLFFFLEEKSKQIACLKFLFDIIYRKNFSIKIYVFIFLFFFLFLFHFSSYGGFTLTFQWFYSYPKLEGMTKK